MASTRIYKTFSSEGTRNKWTFSVWLNNLPKLIATNKKFYNKLGTISIYPENKLVMI